MRQSVKGEAFKAAGAAFFPRREKDNREENAARTGWHRRRFAVACKRAGWTGTGAVNRACSQPPSSVSPME